MSREVAVLSSCVFCKIIAREIPAKIIAENDQCIVIQDIAPKAPIHLLIIPKIHVADIPSIPALESPAISEAIFALAQQLARTVPGGEQFKLVINNGAAAGQRVFHLHAHFLAGRISEII